MTEYGINVNKDSRLSIASVSIPYGQRWISLKLATQEQLVHVAPGNLFLRLTTEVFTSAGANKGTKTAAAVQTVSSYQTLEPVVVPESAVGAQTIESVQLYINNIFVNPEIHDIYIRRIGFSLIRVHRQQTFQTSDASGEQLLSSFKWPIETIYAGLRPNFNTLKATRVGLSVTSGNVAEWRDWHRFTRNVDQVARTVSASSAPLGLTNADPTAITPADFTTSLNASRSVIQSGRVVFPEVRKTVTTLGISAHGIDIYKREDFKSEFFSAYQPYNFGGYNIVTPEDEGALMINFCLYPGTYQPSGHLNVSRAREFYLKWTGDYAGSADLNDPSLPAVAKASWVCVGIALNFLLISDGSAVLRYST